MKIDLFMLNGTVAMAVPAAEAGSTATMGAESKSNESGGAASSSGQTNNTIGATQESTDTNNEASTGGMTGSTATPETSGNTGGETGGTETTGTDGSVNETTGNDTGMAGGDTANMAGDGMGGMDGMNGMNTEVGVSKSITQNAPVMIGITAGVLALSILVGIGLAKLKIKKGINLYED